MGIDMSYVVIFRNLGSTLRFHDDLARLLWVLSLPLLGSPGEVRMENFNRDVLDLVFGHLEAKLLHCDIVIVTKLCQSSIMDCIH